YTRTDKEISDSYRKILANMRPNSYSTPQQGKSKDLALYKIFYLKEFVPAGAPPLSDVEAKLKNQLISQKIEQEGELYLKRLRKHFDVQDSESDPLYPEDFQPFVLK